VLEQNLLNNSNRNFYRVQREFHIR